MIRILIKAFILVCIILSIYFIVNPSACSNLINGRVVNTVGDTFKQPDSAVTPNEMLGPSGDKTHTDTSEVATTDDNTASQTPYAETTTTTTTSTMGYSQEEFDYAIANRYVELEQEYAKKGTETKDMAKEISYKVMDDFEMTPDEWEAFLQRATASNLFDKVRQEYTKDMVQQ